MCKTSLCNANSNILQILSLLGAVLIIQEKASVFSYPGYTETVKYQIAKNCYWKKRLKYNSFWQKKDYNSQAPKIHYKIAVITRLNSLFGSGWFL